MTEAELAAVVKGIAPAIKAAVAMGLRSLEDRMGALEKKDWPLPPDGKDGVPGPIGEKGLDGARGADGPAGPQGASGRDGADGLPGPVGPPGLVGQPGAEGARGPEGADGKPGRDGRDGLPGVPGQPGEKGMDGRHGLDGKDGVDGFGITDISALSLEGRILSLKFEHGELSKVVPVELVGYPLYRGVWTEGKSYAPGDRVTWGGSEWHCNEPTMSKPGEGLKAWTLCVKRGRDGKDGKDAPSLPVVSIGGRR